MGTMNVRAVLMPPQEGFLIEIKKREMLKTNKQRNNFYVFFSAFEIN
jgi:hypothetical protein